jgi:Calcineurin-like phosphoesterase
MNTSVVPGYPPRPARKFTKAELVQMKAQAMSDPKLLAIFGSLNTYLEDSENQLIQVMVHNNIWTSPPSPPAPVSSGDVEFGLLAYWLNYPGDNTVLQDLQEAWKWVVGSLPATQLDPVNYQNLINAVGPGKPGIVASDGTLIGSAKMDALLDPGWLLAPFEYLYHLVKDSYFSPFPQSPPTITLTGANPSQVTIALVGDWGTGNYPTGPAATVMQSIAALKPDYIIHLGDVYYTGLAGEEQNNLLGLWAPGYAGKSLTLNSNHEMYDGAFGYFGTALANPIFSLQKKNSYFVLQYGNPQQNGGPWSIIGLDSAYWSTSALVMVGSIQENSSSAPGANAQPTFLQGLVTNGLSPKNAIVLTHHNPLSTDGCTMLTDLLDNNLWAQVTSALNGAPAAWYWGHIHNGIIYPNPTATGDSFYGRCVGHGAIPTGNAWGLAGAPASQVLSYDNTPLSGVPLRVMNGFALLTITTTGLVTETFYQQDGHPAIWPKPNPFTYQLG